MESLWWSQNQGWLLRISLCWTKTWGHWSWSGLQAHG